jgi:aspartate aminotransferase-like enzyme
MTTSTPFIFKIATESWEFEQIHKLNYRSFVEEIPQHPANDQRVLVDGFHNLNTYAICLAGNELAGMLALNDQRPFSLDRKLENLDSYLPPGRSIVEIRLLAIEERFRHSRVIDGLLLKLAEVASDRGWNMAVISGTERQLKLYHHLGFEDFGPLLGNDGARFQPMYLTLERAIEVATRYIPQPSQITDSTARLNLLPGPVSIRNSVTEVFGRPPISHRSSKFMNDFQDVKAALCSLTGARHVEIATGSGTLANEMVAAQISLLRKPGVILANGEFGWRLVDHARRLGLRYRVVNAEWGEPFSMTEIERAVSRQPDTGWIWMTHCETSSGILNPIEEVGALARKSGIKLCLDCMSSINVVPLDLSKVYLATATSGKGLGAYPGLALVFYNHKIATRPRALPRYLDLGFYAATHGVPFTISSNLVYALQEALRWVDGEKNKQRVKEVSQRLREDLERRGYRAVGSIEMMSPAVITIVLPPSVKSVVVGDWLEARGFWISYRSYYLIEQNLIQICLMGEFDEEKVLAFPEVLERAIILNKKKSV